MPRKGTASLEVKSSERNRELENFASLEQRVCEVLLYFETLQPFSYTVGSPENKLRLAKALPLLWD